MATPSKGKPARVSGALRSRETLSRAHAHARLAAMKTPHDFFELDALFSEDELRARDVAHEFVRDRVKPLIREHYRAGTFPREVVGLLAGQGYLGATLSTHGCAGIGDIAYGLVMQELERADTGVRSFCSVTNGLVMHPIATLGSAAQKDRWLPRLRGGEVIGCFGLSEAGGGSNPAGMRTRAQKKGAAWVLNGSKLWITNGSIADVAVVFAQTDEGVRAFLVERGMPGFTATDLHGKLSLRASVTSELAFRDVEVPEENRLPDAIGIKAALTCLNKARYSICWGVIGAAQDAFDEALAFAQDRNVFDEPITAYQLVQEKFVTMWQGLTHARMMAFRLGQLMQAGRANPAAISAAKRANVAMALDVTRTCRDILGAHGILDDFATMRHMCNLETVYTYEGTHDIHTLVLGQAITGESAFTRGR